MLCALTYTKQKKTSSAMNMLVQSYFSHTFIRFASTPFPIANLRHVFTVLVDAGLVIEQLVAHKLFGEVVQLLQYQYLNISTMSYSLAPALLLRALSCTRDRSGGRLPSQPAGHPAR